MAADAAQELPEPAGLGHRGRALWHAVTADYDLSLVEAEVLTEACRCADLAELLAVELIGAPLTVTGSAGQPRPNPLHKELRDTRALLAQLLGRLELPVGDNPWDGLTASGRARKAARARWG